MGMALDFLDRLWGGDNGGRSHGEAKRGSWLICWMDTQLLTCCLGCLNLAAGVGGRVGRSATKFDRHIHPVYHPHIEQLDFFVCVCKSIYIDEGACGYPWSDGREFADWKTEQHKTIQPTKHMQVCRWSSRTNGGSQQVQSILQESIGLHRAT